MDQKETKFEEDLKAYFPDIYRIHSAGKFDKFVWEAINGMMEFMNENKFGELTIKYQNGRINQIMRTVVSTADKESRPNLTAPNYL